MFSSNKIHSLYVGLCLQFSKASTQRALYELKPTKHQVKALLPRVTAQVLGCTRGTSQHSSIKASVDVL